MTDAEFEHCSGSLPYALWDMSLSRPPKDHRLISLQFRMLMQLLMIMAPRERVAAESVSLTGF